MIDSFAEELDQLIEAFCQGDEAAFEQIVSIIYQDILNIAYLNSLSQQDAEDVLQSVLFKIYRKLKSFRGSSKFSTWVYRITVNASIDLIRKKKRLSRIKEKHKANKQILASRDNLDIKHKKKVVTRYLAELPLRQRQVFILRHFQNLTLKQISKVIGCTQSTVKTHLFRAIESLKAKVAQRG